MRKILGNKKGISTILAALLMVVIVVVASVMVYAWSTGLLGGLLVTPPAGQEALSLEAHSFETTTPSETVTLNIRNTGTAATSLITYYVKDSAGNRYDRTGWTGPTGNPNGLLVAQISIGSDCPSPTCTQPTGSGTFSFQQGFSYTVTVVTSRNAQFNFNVVR